MARPKTPAPVAPIIAAFDGMARDVRQTLTEAFRVDHWRNVYTGLGGSRDKTTGMVMGAVAPLPLAYLDALYNGSDLAARIVDQLPTDALSAGFSLGASDLDRAAERWGLGTKVLDGRTWGRLYGGGAVYLSCRQLTTGPASSPLRMETIGKGDLLGLVVLDRQDLSVAEVDPDGVIRMFRVGTGEGALDVHPSRVVFFGGAKTTPRMRQTLSGFDLSVLQRPHAVLADVENSWRSIMNLVQDMSQAVFGVKGLMSMIANGRKDVVLARMEVADVARSATRSVLIDADGESFTHTGAANVTGVDPVLMRTFQRLASAAEMPVSILLGQSAAGLNATGSGESDLRIWYAQCAKERKVLEPGILYLAGAIARSEGLKPSRGIEWPALWSMTDVEKVTLDKLRADTAAVRIQAQITDPEEESRVLGGESLEDVLAERPPEPGEFAEHPEDDRIDIDPGSVWIDTGMGNRRVQVQRVAEGKVYAVDLDGGGTQFALLRSSFLARCTPAPEAEPVDPAGAPAPGAPAAPVAP